MYLCSYCLRRREQLESSWRGFIKPIVVTTIIGLLLFLEPDYGNTAILFSIAICILFIGGAKISQLSILTVIFITFLSIAIYFNPERLDRVLSYANPWDDMTGSDYQLINALIASVQGGLTGLGIGESTQKYFFLPEAHTDFIFSIFLEETGLLGFSILMACYFVILWRLFKLAETFFQRPLEHFLLTLRTCSRYVKGPLNQTLCDSKKIVTARRTNMIIFSKKFEGRPPMFKIQDDLHDMCVFFLGEKL